MLPQAKGCVHYTHCRRAPRLWLERGAFFSLKMRKMGRSCGAPMGRQRGLYRRPIDESPRCPPVSTKTLRSSSDEAAVTIKVLAHDRARSRTTFGVHETQVSRDERNEYFGITLERAAKILDVLNVRLRTRVAIDPLPPLPVAQAS